jgi:hypothetical protein
MVCLDAAPTLRICPGPFPGDSHSVNPAATFRMGHLSWPVLHQLLSLLLLSLLLADLVAVVSEDEIFSMNDVAKYGGLLFFMSAISATVSGKLADRWINAGATLRMARQVLSPWDTSASRCASS